MAKSAGGGRARANRAGSGGKANTKAAKAKVQEPPPSAVKKIKSQVQGKKPKDQKVLQQEINRACKKVKGPGVASLYHCPFSPRVAEPFFAMLLPGLQVVGGL